jgi:hypothetical protein
MKPYTKKIIYTTSPDNLSRFLNEWEAEENVKDLPIEIQEHIILRTSDSKEL